MRQCYSSAGAQFKSEPIRLSAIVTAKNGARKESHGNPPGEIAHSFFRKARQLVLLRRFGFNWGGG